MTGNRESLFGFIQSRYTTKDSVGAVSLLFFSFLMQVTVVNPYMMHLHFRTSVIRFSHNRLVRCCFIALVFLSVTFTFFIVSSKNIMKAVYQAKNGNNPVQCQTKFTDISSNQSQEKLPDEKLHLKRFNVIILSLPRSGSSFLGEVFNHHPQVLYFFEPLHSIQGKFSRHSLFQFDFTSASYRRVASKFLKNVLACDFADGQFTNSMNENDRHRSRALNSSPFCVGKGNSLSCTQVTSRDLQAVCENAYNVTVMKILTPRIPTGRWDKQLLPRASQKKLSEFRIIHLVRDPRAVVNSLMSLKFFTTAWETKPDRIWLIEKICRQVELDANVGMLTGKSLGARYRLIRFEDLARHPLSVVSELFDFVGLEMLDGIKQWLYEATHSERERSRAFDTRRNSEVVVFNWRQEMNSATVEMVEKYCGKVMDKLGYKRTGESLDRQLNLNISLFV